MTDLALVGDGFKIFHTPHFTIIHDVSDQDLNGFRTAAERTYRSNIRYLQSLDIEPRFPKAKLHIFYFAEEAAYQKLCNHFGRSISFAAGQYFLSSNRSAFYNLRSRGDAASATEAARQKAADLGRARGDAKSSRERRTLQKQIGRERAREHFVNRWAEENSAAILQHELTHHVFFNIGLHHTAFGLQNPRWFVEGVASIFESISTGKSANIGAVNAMRLRGFREDEKNNRSIPLRDLLTTERMFDNAQTVQQAYNTAWALAHYLNRTKRSRIKVYVNRLLQRGDIYRRTAEQEIADFEAAFGTLDDKWIAQWKAWMKNVR